jgi:hypothetical protein
MTPVAITCWLSLLTMVTAISMMIRGEIIQSDFHKYVAIGISCISAILLVIACLFA